MGAVLAAPAAADAATFPVTNLLDDGSPESLRGAVAQAETTPGFDRILFDSALSGTLTLENGAIEISYGTREIDGPGANRVTVSGNDADRIFKFIAPDEKYLIFGNDLTIAGLTLADGNAVETSDGGGAILSLGGDLTLEDSVVRNSEASDGGAISQKYLGSLTLESTTITGNSATDIGGGITAGASKVLIQDSKISDNQASDGGGLFAYGTGPLRINSSTVDGNLSRQRKRRGRRSARPSRQHDRRQFHAHRKLGRGGRRHLLLRRRWRGLLHQQQPHGSQLDHLGQLGQQRRRRHLPGQQRAHHQPPPAELHRRRQHLARRSRPLRLRRIRRVRRRVQPDRQHLRGDPQYHHAELEPDRRQPRAAAAGEQRRPDADDGTRAHQPGDRQGQRQEPDPGSAPPRAPGRLPDAAQLHRRRSRRGQTSAPSSCSNCRTARARPPPSSRDRASPTTGTAGDDVIVGTAGPDQIDALGGNDLVCGRAGDDVDVRPRRQGQHVRFRWRGRYAWRQAQGCAQRRRRRGSTKGWFRERTRWSARAERTSCAGNSGNDRLLGRNGADDLFGNSGDDRLIGGRARTASMAAAATTCLYLRPEGQAT